MEMEMTTAISTANSALLVDAIDINRIAETMQKVNTFQAIIQKNLQENRDYGKIPGTDKPTLLKSGAEKVNMLFGLYPEYDFLRSTTDFDRGFFDYAIRCTLYRNSQPVAQGVGCCNSHEKKYRYVTKSARQLEEAGIDPGDAVEFTDRYGGTKYRVEDPDIADKANTILKMAKKRAYVDATLQVASLSDLFTQDLEDYDRQYQQESTETMTVKEALAIRLSFGKHKGKSLKELWDEDRGYLDWLLNGEKTDPVIRKAIRLMTDYVTAKAARHDADAAHMEPPPAVSGDDMPPYEAPPMPDDAEMPDFLREDNADV